MLLMFICVARCVRAAEQNNYILTLLCIPVWKRTSFRACIFPSSSSLSISIASISFPLFLMVMLLLLLPTSSSSS
ncbi:hypothetical protein E2C01_082017 [Portunus trituberculatus]|uniref:Uncharacterized protein n=1 Tax=Portunus trituberculatus TaxID=210409 RepID=A0A5B7IXC4_PORTR|nr:hypothetical protein [Portunus trituberculatus]